MTSVRLMRQVHPTRRGPCVAARGAVWRRQQRRVVEVRLIPRLLLLPLANRQTGTLTLSRTCRHSHTATLLFHSRYLGLLHLQLLHHHQLLLIVRVVGD